MGKYHVQLCGTTPCWLCGSDDIMAAIQNKLGESPSQRPAPLHVLVMVNGTRWLRWMEFPTAGRQIEVEIPSICWTLYCNVFILS